MSQVMLPLTSQNGERADYMSVGANFQALRVFCFSVFSLGFLQAFLEAFSLFSCLSFGFYARFRVSWMLGARSWRRRDRTPCRLSVRRGVRGLPGSWSRLGAYSERSERVGLESHFWTILVVNQKFRLRWPIHSGCDLQLADFGGKGTFWAWQSTFSTRGQTAGFGTHVSTDQGKPIWNSGFLSHSLLGLDHFGKHFGLDHFGVGLRKS